MKLCNDRKFAAMIRDYSSPKGIGYFFATAEFVAESPATSFKPFHLMLKASTVRGKLDSYKPSFT